VEIINHRHRFIEFAREIGMRADWHEPDEKDIYACVEGRSFDNAGLWPAEGLGDQVHRELHVIFKRLESTPTNRNKVVELAAVNLATLCAWASEPE
jgi:hypothetical protein